MAENRILETYQNGIATAILQRKVEDPDSAEISKAQISTEATLSLAKETEGIKSVVSLTFHSRSSLHSYTFFFFKFAHLRFVSDIPLLGVHDKSQVVMTCWSPNAIQTNDINDIPLPPKPLTPQTEFQSKSLTMNHETYNTLRLTNAIVGKADARMIDKDGLLAMAKVLKNVQSPIPEEPDKSVCAKSHPADGHETHLEEDKREAKSTHASPSKAKGSKTQKNSENVQGTQPASLALEQQLDAQAKDPTKSTLEGAVKDTTAKTGQKGSKPVDVQKAEVGSQDGINGTSSPHPDDAGEPTKPNDETFTTKKRKANEKLAATSEDRATGAKATKKARNTGGPTGNRARLPASLEVAAPEDRMLLEEHAKQTPWKQIREKWQEMTGEETNKTKLPYRLGRLKTHFATAKGPNVSYLGTGKSHSPL